MTLSFPQNEIDESLAYYQKNLASAWKLDFNNTFAIMVIRLLTKLAYLNKRPLREHGLNAQERHLEQSGHRVRVRIIRPHVKCRGILVDLHGGGWTLGNAALNDSLNAPRAKAGFAVISVEYRYAPRHHFSDLILDCATALSWALTKGEEEYGALPVVLTGDSAGAHLSLAAALTCRTHPNFSRLKGMTLFYGCYDLTGTPSVRKAPKDTLIMYGPSLMPFFERITGGLSEAARKGSAVSPLYADLHGLPPSLLIVGTADPLLDDSRLLARALGEAGIQNEMVEVPEAPHAFNRYPISIAKRVNDYADTWMESFCPNL